MTVIQSSCQSQIRSQIGLQHLDHAKLCMFWQHKGQKNVTCQQSVVAASQAFQHFERAAHDQRDGLFVKGRNELSDENSIFCRPCFSHEVALLQHLGDRGANETRQGLTQ